MSVANDTEVIADPTRVAEQLCEQWTKELMIPDGKRVGLEEVEVDELVDLSRVFLWEFPELTGPMLKATAETRPLTAPGLDSISLQVLCSLPDTAWQHLSSIL